MSKQKMGWGCVFLVLLGLAMGGQIAAQQAGDSVIEGDVPRRHAQSPNGVSAKTPTAEDRIESILEQPLKSRLQYDEERLDTVLDVIAEEYGLAIVFDKSALDDIAISPESEVTLNLHNVSLKSALHIMFKEPGLEDLCYIVEDEVLLITTWEEAGSILETKVYRVDDFVASNQPVASGMLGASAWADFNPFIGMITSCVSPKSWRENGTGEGAIRSVGPAMLVISQTRHVHGEIKKLLSELRAAKHDILAEQNASDPREKPITRGFTINISFGDDAEQAPQALLTAIKRSVDWSTGNLAEKDAWIELLPGRVLVRHSPKVVQQVENTLIGMQLMAPAATAGGGGGGYF